ncbi:Blp family class II bacteriocin [Streptococcus sobrinus]|uniref:Blp family class II bacteriocin n=1 Tax=Streptococcus sobrinus TaxID=1310 RepID=UPI0002D5B899|nr:Blp family class II bacteriocin [Streptococcus sobrinus]
MKTQAIERFEVMDTEALSTVEGGQASLGCVLGTAGMAGAGFVFGGGPAGAAVLGGATALRLCR